MKLNKAGTAKGNHRADSIGARLSFDNHEPEAPKHRENMENRSSMDEITEQYFTPNTKEYEDLLAGLKAGKTTGEALGNQAEKARKRMIEREENERRAEKAARDKESENPRFSKKRGLAEEKKDFPWKY